MDKKRWIYALTVEFKRRILARPFGFEAKCRMVGVAWLAVFETGRRPWELRP